VTDTRPLHVLIAGGGLAGLAVAQGLRKHGHTVEVFERDPDLDRKQGYYLHMNAFGGEALRSVLPDDLFELYLETSRTTNLRHESIVLDDQFHELSSQPHLGPSTAGPCGRSSAPGSATPSASAPRSPDTPRTPTASRSRSPMAARPAATFWWARTAFARRFAPAACPAYR
jgi:hypothetical protein